MISSDADEGPLAVSGDRSGRPILSKVIAPLSREAIDALPCLFCFSGLYRDHSQQRRVAPVSSHDPAPAELVDEKWAGARTVGRRGAARLVRAQAPGVALGLGRGPGRPRGYAVELGASGSGGSADSEVVLGILQVERWAPAVEQSCRDEPSDQDARDALSTPDARDALGTPDGTQHWMDQPPAVEHALREAARRPHALLREPLSSPGAPFE